MNTKSRLGCVKDWRSSPKAIDKYRFVYHFLPHPETKQRATLLSNRAIIIYCLLVIGLCAVFRIVPKFFPGVLGYASNITVKDLFEYTNKMREEYDKEPLVLNSKLTRAAEKKAKHMLDNGYWAHVSPNGIEPWSFILGEDYDYVYAGENLAKNFANSKDVVEAWYNSPTHRDNLLSPNYDEVGFAVVNGVLDGYETTLVVQMFGRPKDPVMVASDRESSRILSSYSDAKGVETVADMSLSTKKPKVIYDVALLRYAAFGLGLVLSFLLSLDLFYSRHKNISKNTGHTLAHLLLLIVVLIGILFLSKPGAIYEGLKYKSFN